jgi:hypothetical protein
MPTGSQGEVEQIEQDRAESVPATKIVTKFLVWIGKQTWRRWRRRRG